MRFTAWKSYLSSLVFSLIRSEDRSCIQRQQNQYGAHRVLLQVASCHSPFLLLLVMLSLFSLAILPTFAQDATEAPVVDTLGIDSINVSTGGSGFDKRVTFDADSIIFSIDGKKVYLYNNAIVTQEEDKLQAAYIEFDLDTKEVYARARLDSATGKHVGVPLLNYAGEELSALTMTYNFETGRGVSSEAEIAIEDGFIHVDRFKRVSENTVFGENLLFTTCDAPHPHFYFKASKSKLIIDEKIYADQLKLSIEDVPVIALPISVFFALGGGRQSGIILPSFNQSQLRGVELNGLGYFWAINDYLDTRFTTDITSKGFFNVDNRTRFRLRGVIERSDLSVTYGRSRNNIDEPFGNNWTLTYRHGHRLLKETKLGGTLRYATEDAIRATTNRFEIPNRIDDITTQEIQSNFSITSVADLFGLRLPWGIEYRRTQNIVSREIQPEGFTINLNPQPWYPFARNESEILNTFSVGVRPRYVREFRRDTITSDIFRSTTKQGIGLSPSVRLSPKFGYFTLTPSVSLNSSIFFRRIVLQPDRDKIDTAFVNGLYTPFWYSASADISTTLYGIVQPRILGINGIRHRMSPTIGITYSPDFSESDFGYFDEYFNPFTNRIERYSIFVGDDVVKRPSQGETRRLKWELENSFEAKIARGDTLEDRKITLLNLRLDGSYNFADSLFPFSTIGLSAFTTLGRVGNFTGSATLDPYHVDSIGTRIPQRMGFPWVRVTSARLTFSTSFSDQGFNDNPFLATQSDSVESRRERFVEHRSGFDREAFYGERVRGNNTFRIPWEIGLSGTYTITPQATGDAITTFTINPDISFSLTPTTRITSGGSYNVLEGRFNIPTIRLVKDLHDWEMSLEWQQTRTQRTGIFFRIGFTPSMLRDLERTFEF